MAARPSTPGSAPPDAAALLARIQENRAGRTDLTPQGTAPPATPAATTLHPLSPPPPAAGGIDIRRRFYPVTAFLGSSDPDFVRDAHLAILKRLPYPAETARRLAELRRGGRGDLLCRLRFSPEGRRAGVWLCGAVPWGVFGLLRRTLGLGSRPPDPPPDPPPSPPPNPPPNPPR